MRIRLNYGNSVSLFHLAFLLPLGGTGWGLIYSNTSLNSACFIASHSAIILI